MQEFEFIRTKSLQETLKILNKFGKEAKIIAGGTDLILDLRKEKLKEIEYIIDISALDELKYIKKEDNEIKIGGLTLHENIAKSSLINNKVSFLAKACSEVGSPQIRNRGTLAGNIATASPCADSVTPLVALDGILVIENIEAKREIPIVELIKGPYMSSINDNEIITEIKFAIPEIKTKSDFIKLARRNAVAKSRLNFACLAKQGVKGEIEKIKFVPGSVLPSPQHFNKVEEMLIGNKPNNDLLKKAGEMVAEEMINQSGYRWSTDYKKPVVKSLTFRILNSVLEVK